MYVLQQLPQCSVCCACMCAVHNVVCSLQRVVCMCTFFRMCVGLFSDSVTEGEVSSVMTEEGEGGEGRRGDGERGGEPVGDIVEGCSRSESSDEGESEEERGGREEREVVMVEVGKPEWDCESILRYIQCTCTGVYTCTCTCTHARTHTRTHTHHSTYSNLYNHPTKIVEPSSSRPKSTPTIALSKKTGIPLGTIPGPLTKDRPLKQSMCIAHLAALCIVMH